MQKPAVVRTDHRFTPDPHRVIAKPHLPGEEIFFPDGRSRVKVVLERILAIPDGDVPSILSDVMAGFAHRHRDFTSVLQRHYDLAAHHLEPGIVLSEERCLLVGAYFTNEYSIEAAALFNPSMVLAPDQSGLAAGHQRFIMSVRAVGEGHISSIGFRTGTIDEQGSLAFEAVSPYATTGRRTWPVYEKPLFGRTLGELGADERTAVQVLGPLSDYFTYEQLDARIDLFKEQESHDKSVLFETIKLIDLLATSNYVVTYPRESPVSERVLFPGGPRESQGMEDARFVRFVHDDESVVYYATYTAFDGRDVIPQLIETKDFNSFRVATLNGPQARNKGMALFPRKVGGKFMMLGRSDRENSYLLRSDNVHFWNDTQLLQSPQRSWELVQIGNCGSPIETDAGWLVITHGVGPMRRYALGAMLLDLQDPSRAIAHLPEPLMVPEEDEREGYVPNVLYSCGSMAHDDQLVLPYGFSDGGIKVATINMPELLQCLLAHRQ